LDKCADALRHRVNTPEWEKLSDALKNCYRDDARSVLRAFYEGAQEGEQMVEDQLQDILDTKKEPPA